MQSGKEAEGNSSPSLFLLGDASRSHDLGCCLSVFLLAQTMNQQQDKCEDPVSWLLLQTRSRVFSELESLLGVTGPSSLVFIFQTKDLTAHFP